MMIREMTRSDVPFFNIVRNECSNFLHDKSTHTLVEALDWFDNKRKSPYFIYELNETTIGYFRTSNWDDTSCYIGMDIHKKHRGQGYAKKAYREMMCYLKKKYKIKTFKLEVLDSNIRAINLYRKLGFVQTKKEVYKDEISIFMKLEGFNCD